MTARLEVQKWPDRAKRVLAIVDGTESVIVAHFVNDEAASRFLDLCEGKSLIASETTVARLQNLAGRARDVADGIDDLAAGKLPRCWRKEGSS